MSAGTAKSTVLQILFLLLTIMRSGLLAGIRWSVCMLKSHRSLCESFSRTGAGLCIYHLFVWWIFIIIIIISLLESFSHLRFLMFFYWSLSDSKSPQVFRTFLSILTDLNNSVVWTVSIRPVIFKSFSPYTNNLVTVPRPTIPIFMFCSFFHFSSKVQVLIPLFTSFQFYSKVRWDSKVHNSTSSLFLCWLY